MVILFARPGSACLINNSTALIMVTLAATLVIPTLFTTSFTITHPFFNFLQHFITRRTFSSLPAMDDSLPDSSVNEFREAFLMLLLGSLVLTRRPSLTILVLGDLRNFWQNIYPYPSPSEYEGLYFSNWFRQLRRVPRGFVSSGFHLFIFDSPQLGSCWAWPALARPSDFDECSEIWRFQS